MKLKGVKKYTGEEEVPLEIFISEKDLFSSISLELGEICIFLKRWFNPAEWAGVGSTEHFQRVLISSGQINFMLIIGN